MDDVSPPVDVSTVVVGEAIPVFEVVVRESVVLSTLVVGEAATLTDVTEVGGEAELVLEVVLATLVRGAVDTEVLAAESTVVGGEVLLVWGMVVGADVVIVDNAATVVTLFVGETVPTVIDSLSMSNPVTVEDASVKTALI